MGLNGTNRPALRDRLPHDDTEQARYLADAIDDLRRDVASALSDISDDINDLRAEVRAIGEKVDKRLRWVTVSLFTVTGTVFMAALTIGLQLK